MEMKSQFLIKLFIITVIILAIIFVVIKIAIPNPPANKTSTITITKWAPPPTVEQQRENNYKIEHPAKPNDLGNVVIKQTKLVRKKGCLATEPVTMVVIKGDGNVTYDDLSNPSQPLKKQFKISTDQVKALLDSFYAIDFYSLKDNSITPNCSIDNYSTLYSLTVDNVYTKNYVQTDNSDNLHNIQNEIANLLATNLSSAQMTPMPFISAEARQRTTTLVSQYLNEGKISSQDAQTLLAIIQTPNALVEQCENYINKIVNAGQFSASGGDALKNSCKQ